MSDTAAGLTKQPFPFDYLSLAEVAECERLAARLVGQRGGSAKLGEHLRLSALLARRCRPLYPAEPQDAA